MSLLKEYPNFRGVLPFRDASSTVEKDKNTAIKLEMNDVVNISR